MGAKPKKKLQHKVDVEVANMLVILGTAAIT